FGFLLENAVAVGELTVLLAKRKEFHIVCIKYTAVDEDVLKFRTVCAYILDGRRACRSGDQRQVLNAAEAVVHAVPNEVVPDDATASCDNGFRSRGLMRNAFDHDVDNQSFKVTGEQHITASSQYQDRLAQQFFLFSEQVYQFLLAGDLHEIAGGRFYAEGVIGFERMVFVDGRLHKIDWYFQIFKISFYL